MLLKRNTAVSVKLGAFVDKADGVTPLGALTPTVRISKNGGAWGNRNSVSAITYDEGGFYNVPLDATDTNTLGVLVLLVSNPGVHLPVWASFTVLTENDIDVAVSSRLATAGYTAPPTAAAIATAVWSESVRTLTSFGSLVSSIWSNVSRTLTSGGGGGGGATAADVWSYADRRLTSAVAPAVSYIDPSDYDVTIVKGDDYITAPLEFTGMPNMTGWTIVFKVGDPNKPALYTETSCTYASSVVSVALSHDITDLLTRAEYTYSLEATNAGEVRTLALGRLIVRKKVSNAS